MTKLFILYSFEENWNIYFNDFEQHGCSLSSISYYFLLIVLFLLIISWDNNHVSNLCKQQQFKYILHNIVNKSVIYFSFSVIELYVMTDVGNNPIYLLFEYLFILPRSILIILPLSPTNLQLLRSIPSRLSVK